MLSTESAVPSSLNGSAPQRQAARKLSVIVVSYNTRDLLRDCLRSFADEPAEVIVIDNGSTDGSPEMVISEFPDTRLIELNENAGFARANNLALARCRSEYILLLNSDTRVRPGALETLIAFGDAHPAAGAWGPRLVNPDGSLQPSCFRFPSPARAWIENLWISALFPNHTILGDYRRWPHDDVREVDFLVGAALVVRRDAIDRVGELDERFFMYSEETDWCLRMRRAGWNVMFTPDASIVHLGAGSAGVYDPDRQRRFFASLDRYERKHHGIIGWVSFRMAMVTGSLLRLPLWCAAFALLPHRRKEARAKIWLHAWLLFRQAFYWPHGERPR